MNIKQIEHGSKGAFLIEENNEHLAEITYSRAGDSLIIIDHTEVSDKLRGQGAGKISTGRSRIRPKKQS